MKKINKIFNYIIWIPFAVSIGSIFLYIKYLFTVKLAPNAEITKAINILMERYLKIGIFSLFIGVLLIFVNKIAKLIFNEDKYYHDKYPWTNIKQKEPEEEEKRIKKEVETEKEEIKLEELKEEEKEEKIFNDLKENKIIKARLIDNDEDEKMIEILNDDNVVIMPDMKKETVIKIDSSKVKIDGFKHCPKCNNLVVEDAVICVHCGVLLDESIKDNLEDKIINKNSVNNVSKKRHFNMTKFAVNSIIILLCFILIILMCQKIESKKAINESNINITKIENVK